jgi:hypothetical protein
MSWKIGHPIKRDGTNQLQRLLDALRPENNPVDDRRVEDLLLFIYRLADQFAYYNEGNVPEGGWQTFFSALQDANGQVTLASIRQYLAKAAGNQDNPVFLSILLAFLGMYEHLRQDINALTGQHLDFYFEQVLGFRRQPPTPDEVHVLFELAPQATQQLLPAGTALKAGNDGSGKPLIYVTNRDIVVNKAKLAAIKTALITPDGGVFAAEVANSADGLGAPLETSPPGWPLFGDPDFMQPSAVGFAIASPLLLLEEGQRQITLTITFDHIPETITEADFQQCSAYTSGAQDWIPWAPIGEADNTGGKPNLTDKQFIFRFGLDAGQPATVAYRRETLSGNLGTRLPVLRLMLDGDKTAYHQLRELTVKSIDLKVEVAVSADQPGVQNLVLQNEQGALAMGNAIQPFGPAPGKNARFYIGSREVFSKPLDELIIQLRWADLPDGNKGFESYYTGYPLNYKSNDKYTVFFEVLSNGHWSAPLSPKTDIFDLAQDQTLAPDKTIVLSTDEWPALSLAPELPELRESGNTPSQGFIRISLEQDFGHRIFPGLFATVAKGTGTFPNPPYTPALQSISIGYAASQNIIAGQQTADAQFFHLEPFGSTALISDGSPKLLPQTPRAALYLGFSNFEPPQNLHLLFQVAEGSAESTDILRPEDIQWHYLTDRGWRATALTGSEIFIDTTLGLQKPGLMAFQIGRDAGKNATKMPGGLHWLRASIEKDPAGAARAIAIHTQSITAVFQENGNDPGHLLRPLPAGSITALTERIPAIRKVEQPYASFGGTPAEQNDRFYTRVSERLHHKQRAVTLWDIERLTLQQFPGLYEAKAIPHSGLDENGFYSEFQPGQVTVVLVPQLRNRNAVNILQPRVSVALLEEVRRYLQPLCTQFVGGVDNALQVVNPLYEPILLSFSVGFHAGYDSGYYTGVLQETLRRRLSPWAYEEGEDIKFNGKVYKSQLLAFVEEQEYVDYVTDFRMIHFRTEPGVGEMSIESDLYVYFNSPERDTDVAIASTAASILVSADRHSIQTLRPDEFPCDNPEDTCTGGIDCWYVDIDFMVSEQ